MRHRAHSHDELHFSLILAGDVLETVGSGRECGGALSVVCKDAGVVHANEFGRSGARLARLTLPQGTLGSLVDDQSRHRGWHWTHDPRVAAPFLRLVRRAGGAATEFSATDSDVVDVLAAFTARPAESARGTPPAWLAGVVREVRECWHPRLTTATLAEAAGVHPVYLARCVRRWFGTTLSMEFRRQRLLAAARSVHDEARTISDVAHSGGFADEPHLNRAFRAAVGLTPGQYRALIRSSLGWRKVV